MNIETELCKALSRVFQGRLDGLPVEGNWIADETYLKGVDAGETEKLEITVSPRKYEGYTSRIPEFSVTLEATLALSDDASLERTLGIYETIAGILEDWHENISSVKRDLTVASAFDPVGFRLDGGTFELDRETKSRNITQQFTIKGRIH